MKIKYNIQPEDFVAFNMSYMYNNPIMRANIRNTRIISTAIILFGGVILMQLFGKLSIPAMLVYILFAVVIFFTMPMMIKKKVRKGVFKMLMQPQNQHICSEKIMTLEEKEIFLEGGGEESRYTYDVVESVKEDKEHYFIYVGPMAALIVPYRAFETGEAKANFYNKLCEQIQKNGGKIKT